ncbi:MAG: Uncharacterized protein FD123_2276 [Bacteroidetes bacterium]|nr:MAG: Uncharacterized protein FD123_2276 [Bacteroidota bacterium]
MAYFFFIDESGTDRQDSYYEVLCGIAIKDSDLWKIVSQLKNLEEQILGTRYSGNEREIKGKKFLKRKVFKQAETTESILQPERTILAKECIENGANATKRHLAALAQAKLDYVKKLLELCAQYRIKIFASISSEPIRETDDEMDGLLRRDYVYAFERMYYYLEDKRNEDQGIIVFDEIEKSQSHVLISQLENYFKRTLKGRQRSGLVIPEPFFVHSDLTTGIQIADLIAYIISWGLRLKGMSEPSRPELNEFVELIKPLRYITTREIGDVPDMQIWSVTYVK